MKQAHTIVLGIFYIIAGANHFINPEFYLPLIPAYFPAPTQLNLISGAIEIILGIGVLYTPTRNKAALAIIALLTLFIPSHIHFILIGGCISSGLCVPLWIAWVRLIVIHPLLILWAYIVSKK